jgi:hypothetical protein
MNTHYPIFTSRHLYFFLGTALLIGGCSSESKEKTTFPANPVAAVQVGASHRSGNFMSGQDKRKEANDYSGMLQAGRQRKQTNPDDMDAWCTTAYAAYMLGDLDTATVNWQKSKELAPQRATEFDTSLANIQLIRKRWPSLKMQAPVWADGDALLEDRAWRKKAIALLTANKYDEIERTAKTLQSSRAVGVDGVWLLEKFGKGLWGTEEGDTSVAEAWKMRHGRIQNWHRARPASLLARTALMASWTDGSEIARGTAYASEVSPQQFEEMNQRVVKAAEVGSTLLPDIGKSPLVARRIQKWGLLASMSSEEYLELVNEATKRFPTYISYDLAATTFLMTRWFGKPGEWERYAEDRANQVGGIKGDILYARLAGEKYSSYEKFWKENAISWPRVQRGYDALLKQQPNSLSTATTYFWLELSGWLWRDTHGSFMCRLICP